MSSNTHALQLHYRTTPIGSFTRLRAAARKVPQQCGHMIGASCIRVWVSEGAHLNNLCKYPYKELLASITRSMVCSVGRARNYDVLLARVFCKRGTRYSLV